MGKQKILFVGDLNEYGRSFQRCQTFKELGHDVVSLSYSKIPWNPSDDATFIQRVMWKLGIPPDITGINKKIILKTLSSVFDVVWIEKGVAVYPWTIWKARKILKSSIFVSCSEDDMYAKHNRSIYYTRGLKYYDVVFTTKTYNLSELMLLGARRTELFLDSYNEHVHRPMKLTEEDVRKFSCEVGAIGAFEPERAESMLYLAEHGVEVVVWGSGWGSWINRHKNLKIKNEFLFGDDYARAISATKINLNFLRKINRDEVTSRSVEIPACGGFVLGERTKRHLEFFKEGEEAEFFSSNEELLEKIKYYLSNESKRKSIAAAGFQRCQNSGYSMKAQIEEMLKKIY